MLYEQLIFFANLIYSENLSLYGTFGRFEGESIFFRENEFLRENLGYGLVPGTEELLETGYRRVPGTEEIQ